LAQAGFTSRGQILSEMKILYFRGQVKLECPPAAKPRGVASNARTKREARK